MCGPVLAIASLATTVIGGIQQAQAQRAAGQAAIAQANFQRQVAENNRIVAERQAADAILRGDALEQEKRFETQFLAGRQRAALAANGIVVDQGSALDITAGTFELGELDALTIRNNAQREAFGFKAQATNFASDAILIQARGEATNRAARRAASSTLLTTAGKFAGSAFSFNRAGAFG